MNNETRSKLFAILKTLRSVEVRDNDNGNLGRMYACIKTLDDLLKQNEEEPASE